MTRRVSPSVLVFIAGVGAVLAALAVVTVYALRLDREQQRARADAAVQEAIRLALWRMDAVVSPIVAREAARPHTEYQPFYSPQPAYDRMWRPVSPGEVLVPSPLLGAVGPFARLYFQRSADGSLTSPQAPTGNMRDQAETDYVLSEWVIEAEDALQRLDGLLKGRDLEAGSLAAAQSRIRADQRSVGPAAQTLSQGQTLQQEQAGDAQTHQIAVAPTQQAQSFDEYTARQRAAESARNVVPEQQRAPAPPANRAGRDDAIAEVAALAKSAAKDLPKAGPEVPLPVVPAGGGQTKQQAKADSARGAGGGAPPGDDTSRGTLVFPGIEQGEIVPVWVPDTRSGTYELLLVREVRSGKSRVLQGVWLDWPALRSRLLSEVSDRIPGAELVPVLEPAATPSANVARRLAGIPAELVVDQSRVAAALGTAGVGGWTPMRTSLALGWLAAIGAVVAIALVLRASLDLAERRGRFVSAVTHELRTPLTTFCLYSQMLADGMVPPEIARKEYLPTLKREAQRLARIVENVLEYARLGRSRSGANGRNKDHVDATALLERMLPPLRERAEQAGMSLVVDAQGLDAVTLDTDAQTVERIVYNLVDNACKYGADAPDGRVYLTVRSVNGAVEFQIDDHGPGVRAEDEPKIFDAFYRGKSAVDAASPGLGLGLALARGLARQLGGDLRLVRHPGPGARFVLSLRA